ncbi:MAG: hypothetical protein U1F36_11875 [Planctomycetota bacterium]
MQTRERGAAHVNIFFFLVMLVLFLGALGFGYVTLGKNTELELAAKEALAKEKAMSNQLLVYKHFAEDISKEVGEVGEYKREGFNYSEYGNPDPLQNVSIPSRVRKALADFARACGVAEQRGLSAVFGSVARARDELVKQNEGSKSVQDGIQAQVASLQSSNAKVVSDAAARESSLNRSLTDRGTQFDAAVDEKDRRLAQQNKEYGDLRQKMADQAVEHAKEIAAKNKEIETLQARAASAADKVKLLNPANVPDGAVIEASEASGLAWINLGRRDMLPVGTTFEVVKPISGEVKAMAVVRRIEQTRAEVRIFDVKDRYDPVMAGDQVRNDLYSPEMRHNIYLMGRFSQPLAKPVVASLLTGLGNTVVDKLGPGVDLIIVGGDLVNEEGSGFTPITETDEYRLAQNLRIEMAPLSKMRPFLTLGESNN